MSKAFKQVLPRLKASLVAPIIPLIFSIAFLGCTGDDSALSSSNLNKSYLVEENYTAQPGAGMETVGYVAAGEMLSQEGNPINTAIDNYKKYLGSDPKKWGDIVASYQFVGGGFPKSGFDHEYKDGIATEARRAEVEKGRRSTGTFDNGSTITELASLGYTYREFKDPKHKASAQKALDWILSAQKPTGGFPQWEPIRSPGHYSGHATFNDEGMMRILIAFQKAVRKEDPFNSDIFTEDQLKRCETAIEKGIGYILKSQIKENGKLTVWCAQHNMQTYAPETAREYELPSKSGQESALIIAFLMSQPQTPEIAAAVKGGIDWYNSPDTYVKDMKYVRPKAGDGRKAKVFVNAPGEKMWYRFYELGTNKGFFCDKGTGGKKIYGMENYGQLSDDRYYGYVWGNDWGEPVLAYAAKVGYVSTTGVRVPERR